jgi:hypothetical protein
LIVVGISPGLRSLAYCVLVFSATSGRPEIRDSDLSKGGKAKKKTPKGELEKKATPHRLLLDVVIERAIDENRLRGLTTVVAVGPNADAEEPPPHDLVVRAVLKRMVEELRTHGFAVEYMEWQTSTALEAALGSDPRAAVRRALNHGTTLIRGAAFTYAAAAALAAQKIGPTPPKALRHASG